MITGKSNKAVNLICGILIMAVNLYWIWQNARLYWIYRDTSILYLFRKPDSVLIINMAWGCIGLLLGFKVIERKVLPLRGILFQLGIIIIWTLAEVFYYDLMKFLDLF